MTLEQAWKSIEECATRMNSRYRDVVFDEWAIVSFGDSRTKTVSYQGPRPESFHESFPHDASTLRGELKGSQYHTGDFEFARDGVGTGFEAFMVLGNGLYLFCNNTAKAMEVITENPLWLSAQVAFVELGERFRSNPLLVA